MKAVRLFLLLMENLALSTCIPLRAPHILQVLQRVWLWVKSSVSFSFAQLGGILMIDDRLNVFMDRLIAKARAVSSHLPNVIYDRKSINCPRTH